MRVDHIPEYMDDHGDDDVDGGDNRVAGAPRQSYNFAPGYHGVVYRADVPDCGAGPRKGDAKTAGATSEQEAEGVLGMENEDEGGGSGTTYQLQSMKWGLIPFWTKRSPDYGSMMKTINCRDDSLAQSGGMWSTMKARKRCIVVAQGFFEWLKKDGGRVKIPHFVKRKDDKLMCFAGLWDCVHYENEDEKLYTYTIITTDSNKQLSFLHDRMSVILENGSEDLRTWLDPKRHEWSKELQSLLKPYEGELEVYPVSKDVGKVGNNSPSFIIPIDSKENKSNIKNFFAKGTAKQESKKETKKEEPVKKEQPEVEVKKAEGFTTAGSTNAKEESVVGKGRTPAIGVKREAEDEVPDEKSPKKAALASTAASPSKISSSPQKSARSMVSATSNGTKSPSKTKQPGTQKITKFFANSS
ncbi:DUF159-domain-containing protein [Xylariomycetidae sp. FL0641]|nr:DUF159-domain-containing protein [Xylariomycetidae sp. FL0641]